MTAFIPSAFLAIFSAILIGASINLAFQARRLSKLLDLLDGRLDLDQLDRKAQFPGFADMHPSSSDKVWGADHG
jgi:hypothetical protein